MLGLGFRVFWVLDIRARRRGLCPKLRLPENEAATLGQTDKENAESKP